MSRKLRRAKERLKARRQHHRGSAREGYRLPGSMNKRKSYPHKPRRK